MSSVLAHVVTDEHSILDELVHPFTGLDHLAAIALVALSGTLLILSLRGRTAATTAGTTTRIRSRLLAVGSAVALVASIALLVLV